MSNPALSKTEEPNPLDSIKHIGLLAGEGRFPFLIAQAARDRDVRVTAFALKNVTPENLEEVVDEIHWLELGHFQHLIELFHEHDIHKIVMAGRVRHSSIFQLRKIDIRGIKLLGKMANKKADSILKTVTDEFARENVEVLDSTLFLRSLMPPPGILTTSTPPGTEVKIDIDFGYQLAKEIAGMDIGQTVVVKSQTVVAVEAMEGTDGAIERAGKVAGEGTVVVKVSKPMQDKRFDVPVIGLRTIRKMIEARSAALAFTGGETLFFDQAEAIALAEENGISIVAV